MRNTPPVTLNILIITILIWIASVVLPARLGIDLNYILGLHYWQSDAFMPYQLFTYIFLHDTSNMSHLFFNMFGFWMFGRSLESIWGAKKFIFFYFVVGIGAGLVQEAVWMIDLMPVAQTIRDFDVAIEAGSAHSLAAYQYLLTQGDITTLSPTDLLEIRNHISSQLDHVITVGASGSLFGILLAFGWLFPNAQLLVFFIIPVRARLIVALYAIAELFLGVFGSHDGIAHFAHLGGMLFAALLLLLWKKQDKLY